MVRTENIARLCIQRSSSCDRMSSLIKNNDDVAMRKHFLQHASPILKTAFSVICDTIASKKKTKEAVFVVSTVKLVHHGTLKDRGPPFVRGRASREVVLLCSLCLWCAFDCAMKHFLVVSTSQPASVRRRGAQEQEKLTPKFREDRAVGTM